MLVIRMHFTILLVLLVGFADSRKLKLVEYIEYEEESVDTITDQSLDDESDLVSVLKPEKGNFESAIVLPFDVDSARADRCWRADGPFRWKANCDFRGRNVATVRTNNFPDCRTACDETEKCTHFTYNFAHDTCYLQQSKNRLTEIPSEEGICGFVAWGADSPAKLVDNGLGRNCWNSDENGLARWGAHCKFDGNHLNSYPTKILTECRLVCRQNKQCTHFNYDYVNKMCYLIRSSHKSQLESQQNNYFCGLINRPFVPPVTTTTAKPIPKCWNTENPPLSTRVIYWGDQCDFNGRDVTRYSTSSLSDCRMSCSNDLLCTHFTFNVLVNMCYLKRSTVPFSSIRARNRICGFVLNPNGLIPRCP